MRKVFILFFVLSITIITNAQDSTVETKVSFDPKSKADKLFKRMWYKEAAALYETEIKKIDKSDDDSELFTTLKKAGDSYYFNTDMKNANRIYARLVSEDYSNLDPEYLFKYAHSLEGIGKYKEAKRWMKVFAKRANRKDNRSEKYSQRENTIDDVLNIEPQFVLNNLAINTKYSDFGPMYYKDKLVYSSAVDSSNYHTRIYYWNEQPFLNMYLGEINTTDSRVKKIGDFSKNLNTIYHEATLAFTPDEKTVYFTRNNYDGKLKRDKNGTNHLKLYRAELRPPKEGEGKEWTNVKELPFNSEDYSVGHPTISKDGKLLYFVSDMPGSIGATDIFVVDIIQDKDSTTYSQPRNLGNVINTPGREMFPYITNEKLYFASDGHLGLGGLDVFESSITNSEFGSPKNLGAPLNSKLDDFSFIINEEKNTGFVASNRKYGKGDDDIYSFVRTPLEEQKPICEQFVSGYVANTITGERIANTTVTLYNQENKELEKTVTDINGNYEFKQLLDCGTNYSLIATKKGYEENKKPFLTEAESGKMQVPLGLKTLDKLIVEENGQLKIKIGIIYFDLDKSYIRPDAAIELNKIVVLMMQYPKMIIKIESHTDSRNSDEYNLSLSDRRAKATKEYLIKHGVNPSRIDEAQGYGESQLLNKCTNGVPCSKAEHQLNRRSEFIILKM